jgi:sulfoxide reductase heme-binding subunit YedZ
MADPLRSARGAPPESESAPLPSGPRNPAPASRTHRPPLELATDRGVRWSRLGKPLVFLLALVPLAYLAVGAATDDLGANPIEALEHGTGLWSLRFLAITLAVTPVRQLTGWNWLARYRRMLGLFTFFYVTVHLLVYAGLDMTLDVGDIVEDVVEHPYVTLGMLGWLLLVPLAITSTKGWIRRLGGRRWNRLHRLTYVVALLGTIHFYWLVKKDVTEPLLYAGVFGVLLGYRLVLAVRRRRAVRAAEPVAANG